MATTVLSPISSPAIKAAHAFRDRFGRAAQAVALAPGRVNLIGEHVDYCGGFVLPMAIDRYTAIAVAPSADPTAVRVGSGMAEAVCSFTLSGGRGPIMAAPAWARYVLGVVQLMIEAGEGVTGFDAWIESNVPLGAGLSSSAALEVATATAVDALHGRAREPMQAAALCQRAEHAFAGVPCGIMDQAASASARAGHAVLLDCRSGDTEHVPLDGASAGVLIANTNVKHALSDGAYAKRRADCKRAAEALGVELLRDATPALVEDRRAALDGLAYRRARHVTAEIERTVRAAGHLRRGDWTSFGRCMDNSHASLRDDFEVSCTELDTMVDIAQQIGTTGGVYGSRMTGGGFGGCTVSLVQVEQADAITQQLHQAYESQTGITPDIFLTRPARGAHVLNLK